MQTLETDRVIIIKKVKGKYPEERDLHNLINYVLRNSQKPQSIYGAFSVDMVSKKEMVQQFISIGKIYRKSNGKKAIHLVISFPEMKDMSKKQLGVTGYKIAEHIGNHQSIFAVHEPDKHCKHVHYHFVINPIDFYGNRIDWKYKNSNALRNFIIDLLN